MSRARRAGGHGGGRSLVGVVLASILFVPLGSADAAAPPDRPPPIEQLTPTQRTSLPDGTQVTLKGGRVATLGVLRGEHRGRMARMAAAVARVPVNPAVIPGNVNPLPVATPVPMKAITTGPVDYRSFCNAAHASACLYYPPNTTLLLDTPSQDWIDSDVLLTDQGVCASDGGVFRGGFGCDFHYPGSYTGSFNPGTPPPGQPIGAGVTSTKHIVGKFVNQLDPKGSILIAGVPTYVVYGLGAQLTTTTAWTCVVNVFLP